MAVDLDNTLLDGHGQLSRENARAVARLRAAGVRVVVATGKHPLAFRQVVRRLKLPGPEICLNGAALFWHHPPRLEGVPLSPEAARTALAVLRQVGLQVARFTARRIVADPGGAELAAVLGGIEEPTRVASAPLKVQSPVWKLLSLCPMGDPREEAVRRALSGVAGLRVVRTSDRFLEVVPEGASKGAALEALLRRLSIDRRQVLAFGDHLNDLEMLRLAGMGVTFTTSPEPVRAAADRVVPPGPTAVAEVLASLDPSAFERT